MKRVLSLLLGSVVLLCAISVPVLSQTTPNLGFNIPTQGAANWGVLLDNNFSSLDGLLSGGTKLPTNFYTQTRHSWLFSGLGCTSGQVYSPYSDQCVSVPAVNASVNINGVLCSLGGTCTVTPPGTIPMGAYNSGATYVAGDLVSYSNLNYICITGCSGVTPTVGANWMVMYGGQLTTGQLAQLNGAAQLSAQNVWPVSQLFAAPAVYGAFVNAPGTVIGTPTFTAGKFGNAMGGISDSNYISVAGSPITFTSTSSWAAEAWVNTTSTGNVVFFSSGPGYSAFFMGLNAGQFYVALNGAATLTAGGAAINDGNWHHVAMQLIGGTQLSLFVDGNLVGQQTAAAWTPTSTSTYDIGRLTWGTGYSWSAGQIDEVAMWTGVRYTANFTPPTSPYLGSELGLVALFHLNADGTNSEASGMAQFDANGNFASLVPLSQQTIFNLGLLSTSGGKATGTLQVGSSSNYNGTQNGSLTYATGKFGTAAAGFSSSSYITNPASLLANLTSTNSWTIEFWEQTTNTSATQVALSFGTTHLVWVGTAASTHLNVTGGFGSDGTVIPSGSAVITDGNWHHIALVMNQGGLVTTWIDGTLAGSVTASYLAATGGGIDLGTFAASPGSYPWNGAIDEVAVWSYPRYVNTFTPPTSAYAGNEPGLLALYHLDGNVNDSAFHSASILDPAVGLTDAHVAVPTLTAVFANMGTSSATTCTTAKSSGTIKSITVLTDVDGDASIDLQSEGLGQYLAGTAATSMSNGNPVVIAGTRGAKVTSFSGWSNTTITYGTVYCFALTSPIAVNNVSVTVSY